MAAMSYRSLLVVFDEENHVVTATMNRPEVINALSQPVIDDFTTLWRWARQEDAVHAIVLRGSLQSRGFSSGIEVGARADELRRQTSPFLSQGVQQQICPRGHGVYKPVVCAVHGICAGAALFLVNDSDLAICSEDAQFFDPHLALGIPSAMGPIGMSRRVPLAEVLRYTLLSSAERMTAATALRIGLVTEVTSRETLWQRADELARIVARYDPLAVQGTLKAIWEGLETGLKTALDRAALYSDATRGLSKPVTGKARLPGHQLR